MNADAVEQARARLVQINGVDRAVIDPGSGDIVLVCHQPIERHHVEEEARAILADLGGDESTTIEVTYRAEHRERARVRFGELRRQARGGSVKVEVDLEWGDQLYHGTASGELGGAVELRTAAQATLAALSTLLVGEIDLRLAGVKQVRSFDAELVVVSLYAVEDPSRKFVGAVVTGPDPLRSAGTAVLSALNRLLGNYLSRP